MQSALPLHATIRQRLFDGVLVANVTDKTGSSVCSFSAFVNAADTDKPVAVIEILAGTSAPTLEWVDEAGSKGNSAYGNKTVAESVAGSQTLFVSVMAVPKATAAEATAAATAAASTGRSALLKASTAWWRAYWEQSFVTLPVTRAEGFYYTQMYRFVSSDRVGLHGLMGAFGPTGNFNFWPDDVWDMNEQVMYWLAAASNRPQISDPMMRIVESGGIGGGTFSGHYIWNIYM